MAEEEKREAGRDELAESLADLFTSISTMIKGELEGTNNQLLLLEKMNQRVAEEYNGYGDVASGLRVFVEQLCEKNHGFEEHVQQIEKIDQQLTEFEAVVSMLDKYVSLLEKKDYIVQSPVLRDTTPESETEEFEQARKRRKVDASYASHAREPFCSLVFAS